MREERDAFATHATRIVRAIAGLCIFVMGAAVAIIWQVRVATHTSEAASEAAAARVERLALAVAAGRDETREAREAIAEQPRLEVVPPAGTSSAQTVVLVAPVKRSPGAPAAPRASASVLLPLPLAPSTGAGAEP